MTSDQERAAPAPAPVAVKRQQLIAQAEALLALDERGALVPHGIGGLARQIIAALLREIEEPELRAEIVSLQAEVERLTADRATVARIWKSLGIKTYEEAGGREISEIVADLTSRVEALSAEVGTARAAAFEEAAQIAEAEYQRHNTGSGFDSHPARETAYAIREAIRSRAALDKGSAA